MPLEPQASNPPAAPAAPAPPPAPAPIKLTPKFGGKVEEMDLSKPETQAEATRLIQLGKLHEQKSARLQELQNQFEAKKPMLQAAEKLSEMAATDPVAFRSLMQTYEAVKQGRATPEQLVAAINGRGQQQADPSGDGEPVAPTSAGVDAQTRALLAGIDSKLNGMAARFETIEQATARKDREGLVDATLGGDELLASRPAAKALVRSQILARMDGGMSLEEATSLETQAIRTILGETATAERDRRKAGEEMRTTPPSAGVPPTRDFLPKPIDKSNAGSPEAFMKAGWKETKEKARDYARAFMRSAVQGPNQ